MSRLLIGALVGGVILFAWQFLSWGVIHLHKDEFKYAENQDAIMEVLTSNLTEDGGYMLPNVPPDASKEETKAYYEANVGKPWIHLRYNSSMESNSPMSMIRSLIVNILAAFLLAWVLIHYRELSVKSATLSALAVGVIAYLTTSYQSSIWMEYDTMMYLVDAIVQWGLCGLWLGFWLPGKAVVAE